MSDRADPRPAEAPPSGQEAVWARNARYGMRLFLVYLLFYAGFVLLNAFRPEVMDLVPAAGVNLAIWYGFALIFLALALALVYGWLCRAAPAPPAGRVRAPLPGHPGPAAEPEGTPDGQGGQP